MNVAEKMQRRSGGLYLGKWSGEIFKGHIGEVLMFREKPGDQIKVLASLLRES
jgi:hypothetical protein